MSTKVVGRYLTQSGAVGALIQETPAGSLRWRGKWGAGSGGSRADMLSEIQEWLDTKRGIQVDIAFPGTPDHPRASPEVPKPPKPPRRPRPPGYLSPEESRLIQQIGNQPNGALKAPLQGRNLIRVKGLEADGLLASTPGPRGTRLFYLTMASRDLNPRTRLEDRALQDFPDLVRWSGTYLLGTVPGKTGYLRGVFGTTGPLDEEVYSQVVQEAQKAGVVYHQKENKRPYIVFSSRSLYQSDDVEWHSLSPSGGAFKEPTMLKILRLVYRPDRDQFTVDRVSDYPLFSQVKSESKTGLHKALSKAEFDAFLMGAQRMGIQVEVTDKEPASTGQRWLPHDVAQKTYAALGPKRQATPEDVAKISHRIQIILGRAAFSPEDTSKGQKTIESPEPPPPAIEPPAETGTPLPGTDVTLVAWAQAFEVDDYPSGRDRVKAKWYVETNPRYGSRICRQTTNPRNGRWNAPKCSTYGRRAALARGSDERVYGVVEAEFGGMLSIVLGTMEHGGVIHERDPAFQSLLQAAF